jgi:ankyrin repeat protein
MHPCSRFVILPGLALLLAAPLLAQADDQVEALWAATKAGDVATVKQLLEEGVDVNARNRYNATALFFACDRGHTEVARVLIEHGADVNAKDNFYNATPLTWAVFNDRLETIRLLLEKGAQGLGFVLNQAVNTSNLELLNLALEAGKPTAEELQGALELAEKKVAEGSDDEAAAQMVARLKTASPSQE